MTVRLPPLPPPATLAEEAGRAALVAGAFVLILLTAEVWRRRAGPPTEWSRKLVHGAGSLLVAVLPWVLTSPWTVVVLALLVAAVLQTARRLGQLECIHAVERRSAGVLFFLLGAALLFLVGRGQPVYYLISILILGLADPLAALFGSAYGRRIYRVGRDRRSVEGSAVFFLTTFAVVCTLQLVLLDRTLLPVLLIALQVALLLTCLEGVSPCGSDNLIVPLAGFYSLVALSPATVGGHLFTPSLVLGCVGLFAWSRRRFAVGGVLTVRPGGRR